MTRLVLERAGVRRGRRLALQAADVAFAPGLTAVIGPNGAGKSTLLAAAAGLLPLAQGRVLLDGVPLDRIGRTALARRRAYLPQAPRVEWPISVERVVTLGLGPALPVFGALPAALERRVEAALAACDLLALRHRPATALSGGELARTMLARAIVSAPALLLVDEPTAGLDPRHAIDAMRRLRREGDVGACVVAALHDLDLALRFATRIVALRDGRVVAAGPTAAVMTAALLSDLYDVEARLIEHDGATAVRFAG